MDDALKGQHEAFFKETFIIFKKITQYAVLLEKIGNNAVEIGAINELRSVLFHLYAFLDNEDTENFEFHRIEAIEHLYRSYFDIFSLLCTLLLERIHGYSTEYGPDFMSQICPDYFNEMVPRCSEEQEKISYIRATREKGIKTPEQKVEINDEVIGKLLAWDKRLTSLRNALEDKKRNAKEERIKADNNKLQADIDAKKDKKKDLWLRIVLLFVGAILGALAKFGLDYLTKR